MSVPHRLGRRTFLAGIPPVAALLGTAALVGCSSDGSEAAATAGSAGSSGGSGSAASDSAAASGPASGSASATQAPAESVSDAGGTIHLAVADLRIQVANTRAAEAPSTAAYGTLRNEGGSPVTLVSARSDAADAVELHETAGDGDGMRRVDGGFEIAAGEELVLAPDGEHLMLMGLVRDVLLGDDVPVALEFAGGASLELTFSGAVESTGGGPGDPSVCPCLAPGESVPGE